MKRKKLRPTHLQGDDHIQCYTCGSAFFRDSKAHLQHDTVCRPLVSNEVCSCPSEEVSNENQGVQE